jgi:hypothetical protein
VHIKLTFVINEATMGAAIRAMRPYSKTVTIDDIDAPDAPDFEQQIIGQEPVVERPRKKKAKPVKAKQAKRTKANGSDRYKYGYVQTALLKVLKEQGPMEPKDLHDEMVRKGFKLQSSYNTLYVAKKAGLIRFDGDKLIPVEGAA